MSERASSAITEWPTSSATAQGWMRLGTAPVPQTVRQTIRYHLGHGLAMGYPLAEVLRFAWRYRRSFERSMDRPDEQALRDAWADGYAFARHHGPTASLIARQWRYLAFPLTRPSDPVLFDPPLTEDELAVLNDAMSAYPTDNGHAETPGSSHHNGSSEVPR